MHRRKNILVCSCLCLNMYMWYNACACRWWRYVWKFCEVRGSDKPNVKENLPTMYLTGKIYQNSKLSDLVRIIPCEIQFDPLKFNPISIQCLPYISIQFRRVYFIFLLWTWKNGILYMYVLYVLSTVKQLARRSRPDFHVSRDPVFFIIGAQSIFNLRTLLLHPPPPDLEIDRIL